MKYLNYKNNKYNTFCKMNVIILSILYLACCNTKLAPVRQTPLDDAHIISLGNINHKKVAGYLAVTRIDHSCILLDFNGKFILTDPWFSESSQYHPGELIGIAIDKLPKLSAIIASHGHSDHFDLDALELYPFKDVLFLVGPKMIGDAKKRGFTNVRELNPYDHVTIDNIKITATPAKHKVPEITFILESNGYSVYFGADTLLIPEHDEIIARFPDIDVAFYPVNGLTIRPLGNKQVVMSAKEAAILAKKMQPQIAIPMHYAFKGGWFTETFVLKRQGNAEEFHQHAKDLAPNTNVQILPTGQRLVIIKK
jgi:L-ascorbate metabolism protein UlaG (beta-lactamase superfamily)